MKAYLASHFFNKGGFEYTEKLAKFIRTEIPELDLYLPQENKGINDKKENDESITAEKIARADNLYLKEADILIANIDGVEIDSGVSAEIGYFSALMDLEPERDRLILGLYTDMRQHGTGENFFYINLYTKGLIQLNGLLVEEERELVCQIKKFMNLDL